MNLTTLFLNYSYISFFDLLSSENIYGKQKVMCQNKRVFYIVWRSHIHMSGTPIFNSNNDNQLHWCLLNLQLLVKSCFKLFFYRKMYCNIKKQLI